MIYRTAVTLQDVCVCVFVFRTLVTLSCNDRGAMYSSLCC